MTLLLSPLLIVTLLIIGTNSQIRGQGMFTFTPRKVNSQQHFKEKVPSEGKGQERQKSHNVNQVGKNLLLERTSRAIAELCGTSSSVTCALKNDLLTSVAATKGVDDTWERCQARKEFLVCIEAERDKCQSLAESGYYPVLPPKPKVKFIQDNAWKRLWTSGGCILQA